VDGQVFGEMRQRDPEFGTPFSREEVARVIGIAVDEISSIGATKPFLMAYGMVGFNSD
jgi:hypothetical protein